jgi:histidinol-phosphatase (PHP family)
MIKSDYHIHSSFSGDSQENLERIVERAIQLGLEEIAITDHYDFDVPEAGTNFIFDVSTYVKRISELKEKYRKELAIKIGVEMGIQPQIAKEMDILIESAPFDFVLSSTHTLEHTDLSFSKFYRGKSRDEAHQKYFEGVLKNLEVYKNYNVCSHLDFISRYGGPEYRELDYKKHWDTIEEILKKIIHLGKGIEINTSGFRYGENRFYPTEKIVERYVELGGEILTVGSDSHRAEHIAMDFKKVEDFLKGTGVKYLSSFDKRKVKFKKLD